MVKHPTLFEYLDGVVCTLDIGDQSLIFNWLSRKVAVLLAWGDKTPIKQTQKFGTLGWGGRGRPSLKTKDACARTGGGFSVRHGEQL